MRPVEDAESQLKAAQQRAALMHLHARALAHELSNLMFLAQIQAQQPTHPAGEELRRTLPTARSLARLIADALSPEPKRRLISMADAFREIDALLVQPSRGLLPALDLVYATDSAATTSFHEATPSFFLILHDLLRQTEALAAASSAASGRLAVEVTAGDHEIAVRCKTGGRLVVDGFIAAEARRSGFHVEAAPDGTVVVVLPWANDG